METERRVSQGAELFFNFFRDINVLFPQDDNQSWGHFLQIIFRWQHLQLIQDCRFRVYIFFFW